MSTSNVNDDCRQVTFNFGKYRKRKRIEAEEDTYENNKIRAVAQCSIPLPDKSVVNSLQKNKRFKKKGVFLQSKVEKVNKCARKSILSSSSIEEFTKQISECIKNKDSSNFEKLLENRNGGFLNLLCFKYEENEGIQEHSITLLHFIILYGNIDYVRVLLNHNFNVDYTDTYGTSALQLAAAKNKIDIINLLLEKGANIDYQNKSKYTAFHVALFNEHFEIAALLLKKGASINILLSDNKTILCTAIEFLKVKIIKFLLENGASVNNLTLDGMSLSQYLESKYSQYNLDQIPFKNPKDGDNKKTFENPVANDIKKIKDLLTNIQL